MRKKTKESTEGRLQHPAGFSFFTQSLLDHMKAGEPLPLMHAF